MLELEEHAWKYTISDHIKCLSQLKRPNSQLLELIDVYTDRAFSSSNSIGNGLIRSHSSHVTTVRFSSFIFSDKIFFSESSDSHLCFSGKCIRFILHRSSWTILRRELHRSFVEYFQWNCSTRVCTNSLHWIDLRLCLID